MSDTRTTRTIVFPWFIVAAIVAAFALHRPELAILAAPFVVGFVYATRARALPTVRVATELSSERVMEGTAVELRGHIDAVHDATSLEIEPVVAAGLHVTPPGPARLRVDAGATAHVGWTLTCRHWGVYAVGGLRVRVVEPLSGREPILYTSPRHRLKVLPGVSRLRTLIVPVRTHGFGGNDPAHRVGEGVEFAQVRPYQPGDRRRDVNWRVSSRRGSLWVSGRRPDESADIVVFIDDFLDLAGPNGSSLDAAVRLAGTLAESYLARRERVGVIGFGGIVRWLEPAAGTMQHYRLLDALLETQSFLSYAQKSIARIPVRALPPGAFVVAISPLLDERARDALHDLARFDTVAIEVSAAQFATPQRDALGQVAYRLWNLERAARRRRLRNAGIPVVEWRSDEPVAPVIETLERWHRRAVVRHA